MSLKKIIKIIIKNKIKKKRSGLEDNSKMAE